MTAHAHYAVRAFEVNALDYLLKPIAPRGEAALRRVATNPGEPAPAAGSLIPTDPFTSRSATAPRASLPRRHRRNRVCGELPKPTSATARGTRPPHVEVVGGRVARGAVRPRAPHHHRQSLLSRFRSPDRADHAASPRRPRGARARQLPLPARPAARLADPRPERKRTRLRLGKGPGTKGPRDQGTWDHHPREFRTSLWPPCLASRPWPLASGLWPLASGVRPLASVVSRWSLVRGTTARPPLITNFRSLVTAGSRFRQLAASEG